MGAAFSFGETSEESACSQHNEEGTASDQCMSTQVQTVADNVDDHKRENNRLKEENSVLCQQVLNCKSKINSMELELQERTERLSACLSTQLSADERYLENVGETIRPTVLGKRYQDLESTEWVAAKEQIDTNNSIPSYDALKLLCFMMNEVYHAAGAEVMKREGELFDVLLRPVQYHPLSSKGSKGIADRPCALDSKGRLPPVVSEPVKNEILKCMKKTSHFIDLSGVEDNVKVKAVDKFSLPEGFFDSNDEAVKYLKACCLLAWQFHLVQPPMVVSTETTTYDKNIHNLWFDSGDDTNPAIQYYIWPILFNFEGGGVAAKGRVMLRQSHDDEENPSTYL